jgi:hypothetical protein
MHVTLMFGTDAGSIHGLQPPILRAVKRSFTCERV